LRVSFETTNSQFSWITNHFSHSTSDDKHLRSWLVGKLTYDNLTWSLNILPEKKTSWQTLYQGSINTPSIPPRNKTSFLGVSILQKTNPNLRTPLFLPTNYLYLQFQKKSQWLLVAELTLSIPTTTTTCGQAVVKASVTTPLVPILMTGMTETTKAMMISSRKNYNQIRIPSPPTPKKSLPALPQMIPSPSPMTTIFPLSSQTLSKMLGNITSSIEGNTIQTLTTTTAARMVARTRMGTVIFPPLDAQFAVATDIDIYTAL